MADTGNHAIRRIAADGSVSTVAGGVEGFFNGKGTVARFRSPFSLACDAFGTIFVADTGNNVVRAVVADGTVTTVAGNGQGFEDGLLLASKFSVPNDIALDLTGQLILADFNNHALRRLDRSSNRVETLVGDGTSGTADGPKSIARLSYPTGIAIDGLGRIFVADNQNHRVRFVSETGELSTLTGTSKGYLDGPFTIARFNEPTDLVFSKGELFVADTANNAIRKITFEGTN